MNKKTFKLKLLLIILLAVGVVVNGVFITLYNVDKSVNIGLSQKEMEKIRTNNDRMVEKISVNDSLTDFLKFSSDAGYSSDVKVLYFDSLGSVAQAR